VRQEFCELTEDEKGKQQIVPLVGTKKKMSNSTLGEFLNPAESEGKRKGFGLFLCTQVAADGGGGGKEKSQMKRTNRTGKKDGVMVMSGQVW